MAISATFTVFDHFRNPVKTFQSHEAARAFIDGMSYAGKCISMWDVVEFPTVDGFAVPIVVAETARALARYHMTGASHSTSLKIMAIKLVREVGKQAGVDISLRSAKDYVDSIFGDN